MLRTVVLHGALGRRFGARFPLDVGSTVEAVRALMIQLAGFRRALRDGHYRIIKVRNKKRIDLGLDELDLRLGGAKEIHIVPVVAGASRGLGKILAGVAIVGLAILAPYALPAVFAVGGALAAVPTIAFGIGFGMALSGVAQMLSPQPTAPTQKDKTTSYLFSGTDNVTVQGGPVPLVFGTFLVGSVVISAGLNVEQIPSGSTGLLYNAAQMMALKLLGHHG